MITLDESIKRLLRDGSISIETAESASPAREAG